MVEKWRFAEALIKKCTFQHTIQPSNTFIGILAKVQYILHFNSCTLSLRMLDFVQKVEIICVRPKEHTYDRGVFGNLRLWLQILTFPFNPLVQFVRFLIDFLKNSRYNIIFLKNHGRKSTHCTLPKDAPVICVSLNLRGPKETGKPLVTYLLTCNVRILCTKKTGTASLTV